MSTLYQPHPFKPGDKVICTVVSTVGYFGEKGAVYTVSDIRDILSPASGITFKEDSKRDYCDPKRFKLFKEKTVEKIVEIPPEVSKEKQKALQLLKLLEEKVAKLKNIIENT